MEVNGINYCDVLPNEVVALILQYLKRRDIVAAQLACRLFNNMITLPEDPCHLRINKYFSSLERAPEGTFEDKCLWAVNKMKVIEKLLAAGLKRINEYLYKANEDVYLHICNGKIDVLKSGGGLFVKNTRLRAVLPNTVIEPNWGNNGWLIWAESASGDEVCELVPGGQKGEKGEKWSLEEKEKLFSNRDHFINEGYQKMGDCTDRSREIYLKHIVDDFRINCAVIQEKEIKVFSVVRNGTWVAFDGEITRLKKLNATTVVFGFENSAFESELVLGKNNCTYFNSFEPWIVPKVCRIKNKKDMVLLPEFKESSGFILGGRNDPKLIRNIKELASKSIADLEAILRNSKEPYLGANESLLKRMARDQKKVNRLKLTHQKLIMPLLRMSAQYELIKKGLKFKYKGSKFSLRQNIDQENPTWESPFGHEIEYDFIYEFKNLSTKKTLVITYVMMDSIRRFGFYGGKVTVCRIRPRTIASFLKIKKKFSKKQKSLKSRH